MLATLLGAGSPARTGWAKGIALGLVVLLAHVLLAPTPAWAGPGAARVVVPLKDGTSLEGTVETGDAKAARVTNAAGETKEIPWGDMAPLGVFRVKAAMAPATDGKARLAVAELGVELGLYAEARAEFEKAQALGALDAAACAKAIADAEQRAIEAGVARAERLADAGDIAGAREVARNLKLDFASAPDAPRVDAFLVGLEAQILAREADQRAAEKELEKALLDLDRVKEITRRKLEAKKQADLGNRTADEARALMPNGVVSRVHKLADAADASYVLSRRELGRLRRIVPKEGKDRDEVMAMLGTLDKSQFRLLFEAAKFFARERVYDKAESFAARASYIDPVDPELLELRGEIRGNRIRYKVSDLTNAHPTTR